MIVAQDDGGLRNAAKLGELGFDLAQFDPKAAHLDLIVDPAAEHDLAIGVDLHGVAGPVQNRIRTRPEVPMLLQGFGRRKDWK